MFSVEKDPDADLDYAFKWASAVYPNDGTATDDGWLQGDTLATSVFVVSGPDDTMTVHDGIITDIIAEDNITTVSTDTMAQFWIIGGTAGYTYTVTNRVTTAQTRTEDRSLVVKVVQR